MTKRFGPILALLLALAPAAFAQSTGNIYGAVNDEQGATMPGASITLSGENIATRSVVSGTQGEFRFIGLDPGTYRLAVALAGFGTVNRDIVVNAGSSVTLSFPLKVATVQETVTVTAETPVLDPKKTGTSTTLSREELAQIPNSRDPWAVLRTVPGVLVDRVNTAGTESGQQSGFVGKGSVQQDAMWTLDGVTISDPGAAGSSPTYFDFDAFDEVNVTTGGADVRVASGGVGLNLITKRGTNAFHGGISGFFAHDKLQSSNLPEELEGDARLLGGDKADHADQISDYGFDLGGPVIKDKMWFWGSYGKQDLRIRRLNQVPDKTLLKSLSAKLNWQVAENNTFSVYYFNGAKEKFGRPASALSEDASHSRDQGNAYPGWLHGFVKVEDNHVLSSNFMMNLKYAYYGSGFSLVPQGGTDGDEFLDSVAGVARGSSNFYQSLRPQHTANADFSYFRGKHEFKFGFGYRQASVSSTTAPSGSKVSAQVSPVLGRIAVVQRDQVTAYSGKYLSGYVGDTFTTDRLTLNLGVRYDRQTASNKPTTAIANPLFPGVLPDLTYDGNGTGIEWSDFSPRGSITYALDEGRKTLVRASVARFAGQLAFSDASMDNPIGGIGSRTYGWSDLNGDNFVQGGEVDLSEELALPVNAELFSVNRIDPDYKATHDTEFIVGLDRELAPNFALSLAYTYRKSTNQIYAPFIGLSSSDWVPIAPTSANGYTATGFDLTPEAYARLQANDFGRILKNRPGYSRSFKGAEATLLKRLSNKWMARASFSYNDWQQHYDGTEGLFNPNAAVYDSYGLSPVGQTIASDTGIDGDQIAIYSSGSGTFYWVNGKWQMSATALYQLPAGFEVAANLFGRQGYARPINLTLDNTFFDTVLAQGRIDSKRLDNVWNLDLRLNKNFKFGSRVGASLMADVFNVFNANTVLRRTDNADGRIDRVQQIMNPRIARLGLKLTF